MGAWGGRDGRTKGEEDVRNGRKGRENRGDIRGTEKGEEEGRKGSGRVGENGERRRKGKWETEREKRQSLLYNCKKKKKKKTEGGGGGAVGGTNEDSLEFIGELVDSGHIFRMMCFVQEDVFLTPLLSLLRFLPFSLLSPCLSVHPFLLFSLSFFFLLPVFSLLILPFSLTCTFSIFLKTIWCPYFPYCYLYCPYFSSLRPWFPYLVRIYPNLHQTHFIINV